MRLGYCTGGSLPFPQVIPDGRLVQPLALVQEAGNFLGCVLQKFVLHQELDPLEGGGQICAEVEGAAPHELQHPSLSTITEHVSFRLSFLQLPTNHP